MFPKRLRITILILLIGWSYYYSYTHTTPILSTTSPVNQVTTQTPTQQPSHHTTIPDYAITTLDYIRTHNKAPAGYVGGTHFGNYEHLLPSKDSLGHKISYQERDVHPHRQGINRGPERLVTSPKEAYYTADHYRTFTQIP